MTQTEAEAHAGALARQAHRFRYRARLYRVVRAPDGERHGVTCDGRPVAGAAAGNLGSVTDLSGWRTVAMFQIAAREPGQPRTGCRERGDGE